MSKIEIYACFLRAKSSAEVFRWMFASVDSGDREDSIGDWLEESEVYYAVGKEKPLKIKTGKGSQWKLVSKDGGYVKPIGTIPADDLDKFQSFINDVDHDGDDVDDWFLQVMLALQKDESAAGTESMNFDFTAEEEDFEGTVAVEMEKNPSRGDPSWDVPAISSVSHSAAASGSADKDDESQSSAQASENEESQGEDDDDQASSDEEDDGIWAVKPKK